jgi:hypothetical protein
MQSCKYVCACVKKTNLLAVYLPSFVCRFYLPHIMESSGVMDISTSVLSKLWIETYNINGSHGNSPLFFFVLVVGNGIVGVVNFLGTLPCFWFVSSFGPTCKLKLIGSCWLHRLIDGIDVGFWWLGPYLWPSLWS